MVVGCRFAVVFSAGLLIAGFASSGVWASSIAVTVGVLAIRGDEACIQMWTPTIRYLTEQIVGHTFYLVPLDLGEMSGALEQRKVDFVLTNPGNYVELERRFGVTRLATLRNLRHGKPYTLFGAVIFVRADRDDIHTISDLKNRSFGAVDKAAFGGFQMAWRELRDAGVDPFRDFPRLQFFGFPQDNVVLGVRDGQIDAGTVRTGILERMAAEGQIRLEDFRILNQQTSAGFPFHYSTRLYPEWAFAKTGNTSDELAKAVAIALMKMPGNHPAAAAGQHMGWTVPLDYQPVHELFRELKIGPYLKPDEVSFLELIKEYWYWLALALTTILLSIVHNFVVKRQITLRTGELSQTNRALEKEVAERRKAEDDARRLLDEKRFLAQKCMEVQEDERHHLARELHDELGQCITAIQADAETIQKLSKDSDARLVASASAIRGVSSRIYEVVHSMMQRLRPSVLDDAGLVDTLKEEVSAWQARQPNTTYRLNVTGNLDALGERINISIYRVMQECLTNVAKHSMATEVVINFGIIEGSPVDRLQLEVQDNGVGMDPKSVVAGFGLVGMRERVEALNGEFELSATSGVGTNITVTVPLAGRQETFQPE